MKSLLSGAHQELKEERRSKETAIKSLATGGLQKWPGGGLGLSHKVTGKSQTHVTCKPDAGELCVLSCSVMSDSLQHHGL